MPIQLPRPSILRGGLFFCFIFLHNRHMNILQRIFTDYYKEIKYTLHHRSSEMENIEKMINCGDSSFGGAMYGCPHCGNLKSVPFRYHSRFFPSCGKSIPWNVLHLCLLNWLTFSTDTTSSRLMKISVIFPFRAELCFIVFSILLPVLFPTCYLK